MYAEKYIMQVSSQIHLFSVSFTNNAKWFFKFEYSVTF